MAPVPRYSDATIEHFRHPRNVGRLEDPDGYGAVDDRATENFVSFYLRVEDGRVTAARFRTFGCSACIAASSAGTELARGRPIEALRSVDVRAILNALDGLPADKLHCAELAAQALAAAAEDYERRHATPQGCSP